MADSATIESVFDRADINGDEHLDFYEFTTICFRWRSDIERSVLVKHVNEVFSDIANDDEDHASVAATPKNSDDPIVADDSQDKLRGNLTVAQAEKYFGDAVRKDVLDTLFKRMKAEEQGYITAENVCRFILDDAPQRTVINWKVC